MGRRSARRGFPQILRSKPQTESEAELPENPDLAWDLDEFNNRQRAMDFVMQFEHTLCVYSPSV